MKTFEYKIQGNGTDSWLVTDIKTGRRYMSYISPKDLYAKEVNDYHNNMLEEVLKKYNYLTIGEIIIWIGSEFDTEAKSIIEWWKETSIYVMNHLNEIQEYTDSYDFCQTIKKI
jgi:deoxyhypusine synthase